jgi:hypothetical protein
VVPRSTSSRATSISTNTAVNASGSRNMASVSITMPTSQVIRNSFCVSVTALAVIPNQLCVSPSTSTA